MHKSNRRRVVVELTSAGWYCRQQLWRVPPEHIVQKHQMCVFHHTYHRNNMRLEETSVCWTPWYKYTFQRLKCTCDMPLSCVDDVVNARYRHYVDFSRFVLHGLSFSIGGIRLITMFDTYQIRSVWGGRVRRPRHACIIVRLTLSIFRCWFKRRDNTVWTPKSCFH